MAASVVRILFAYSDLKLGQPDQVKLLNTWFAKWRGKNVDVIVITDGASEDAHAQLENVELLQHLEGVVSTCSPEKFASVGAMLHHRLRKEGWIPREQILIGCTPGSIKTVFFDENGVKRRCVLAHTTRFEFREEGGFTEAEMGQLHERIVNHHATTAHCYVFTHKQESLADNADNTEKAGVDGMSDQERKKALVALAAKTRAEMGETLRGRPDLAAIAGVPVWGPEDEQAEQDKSAPPSSKPKSPRPQWGLPPGGGDAAVVKPVTTPAQAEKDKKAKETSAKEKLKRTITVLEVFEGMLVVIGAGPMIGREGKVIKIAGQGSEKRYRVEMDDGSTTWTNRVRAPNAGANNFDKAPEPEPMKNIVSPLAKALAGGGKPAVAPPKNDDAPAAAAPPKRDQPPEDFPEGCIVEITVGADKGRCGTVKKIIVDTEQKKWRVELEAEEGSRWVTGVKKAERALKEKVKVPSPEDHYEIAKKKLGTGAFGAVHKVTNKSTGLVRAMKLIRKPLVRNIEVIWKEVDFMKRLDHPNIIKCYETYEDARSVYLIMELCTGGELFDRIIDQGYFTEKQAASVMNQVLRGLYYMHSKEICHRDLKPENFLLTSKDSVDTCGVKIIDFGISSNFPKPGEFLRSRVGSSYYVAPEVLAAKYTEMSDLWSFGVITYVVLCGSPPFAGSNDDDIEKKVQTGKFTYDEIWTSEISKDAQDFVDKLLQMDWKDTRMNAAAAMNHVWITRMAPRAQPRRLGSTVMRLKNFQNHAKFKRIALQVVANQMSEDQISHLRETFQALDENGDGFLSLEELRNALNKEGLGDAEEIKALMNQIDSNQSGAIDYTEFLSASLDRKMYSQEDLCWAAFKVFDRNQDGKICKDEIMEVLKAADITGIHPEDIDRMLKEVDQNNDDGIDFKEFMDMMRGGS